MDNHNQLENRQWIKRLRPLLSLIQITLAGFLTVNRAFLCTYNPDDKTGLKCVLETIHECILIVFYIWTGLVTTILILKYPSQRKKIGSASEHLTAIFLALFIVTSEFIRLFDVPDPDTCTPVIEKVRGVSLIFFTITNIGYVWWNDRIPISTMGLIHQSIHFPLSIYIAFYAAFREVVHITKHVYHHDNEINFLTNLVIFFDALNFEFHVLLANYAYLTLQAKPQENENRCDGHNGRPRNLRDGVCMLFLGSIDAAILLSFISLYLLKKNEFLYVWTSDKTGVILVLVLMTTFVCSFYLWRSSDYIGGRDDDYMRVEVPREQNRELENHIDHHEGPRQKLVLIRKGKAEEHENKVITFAAICMSIYNFCGFLYSLQVLIEYENVHEKEKHTYMSIVNSLVVTICSNIAISMQTVYLTKCHHYAKHKIWLYCLFFFNGIQVTINLMEMLEAGIHDAPITSIANKNFIIFTRALSSFAVFYRLASFFRFGHIIEHDLAAEEGGEATLPILENENENS